MALALLLAVLGAPPAHAEPPSAGPSPSVQQPGAAQKPGAFTGTKHGNPVSGVNRDGTVQRGSCLQCHGGPPAQARQRGERYLSGLFMAPGDDLCMECHRQPSGGFPGAARYRESAHAMAPSSTTANRPARRKRARAPAGTCANCHDPHGRSDAGGLIPGLLVTRGDALCMECHGNAGPGQNVAALLAKSFVHPTLEKPRAGAGAACTDCHNPHVVRADRAPPVAPAASDRVAGTRRVRVTNAPGSRPRLEPLAPDDPSPAREYEMCLRCHAGVASAVSGSPSSPKPGAGASDIALLLNPNNPSFHPVESIGRNRGLDPASFAQRWSADRLVYCSDCHSSDGGALRGPHGSTFPALLKKRHPMGMQPDKVQATDLCFDCHAYAAYGQSGSAAARATRYAGHASHSAKGYGCATCHDAHGSTTLPALLLLRPQALSSYSLTPGGGTCVAACHTVTPRSTTYRVAYPR
jgi:predicted CXXCH cytochrome family protein